MSFSGAWGKMIHEKNLKLKISWHCPSKQNLQNHEILPFPYQLWTKIKIFRSLFHDIAKNHRYHDTLFLWPMFTKAKHQFTLRVYISRYLYHFAGIK